MLQSRSVIAVPPGETIKEQLENREMTQREFAVRMNMSEKHISKLINGEVQLTPDVAFRLEMVLGVPAKFWNNLESIYREKILRAKAENAMDEDVEFAKKMPYIEMSRYGWVDTTNRIEERVINLRKFFEIVELSLLNEEEILGVAFRRMSETEKSDFAFLAWRQKAKLVARNIETKPINVNLLIGTISTIRRMTRMSPENFSLALKRLLAECGIALVFLPHIGGSFLHGATFYDGGKIVLGLTTRGRDADKFWFSMFHELGHIVLGHIGQSNGVTSEDEKMADNFASETLIPNEKLEKFISNNSFSNSDIIQFADEIEIDAGIVVGRLQKIGKIPFSWYRDLKKQYVIKNSKN